MKKLTVKKGTQCMACLECVRACSEAFYKEFDPSKACLQIIERNGAAKPMVCVQCGKCAEACEHGAITQNAKGVYTINKKLCVGCGKCKDACPFGVLVKVEEAPNASKCIACGICAKACPMEILSTLLHKSVALSEFSLDFSRSIRVSQILLEAIQKFHFP